MIKPKPSLWNLSIVLPLVVGLMGSSAPAFADDACEQEAQDRAQDLMVVAANESNACTESAAGVSYVIAIGCIATTAGTALLACLGVSAATAVLQVQECISDRESEEARIRIQLDADLFQCRRDEKS